MLNLMKNLMIIIASYINIIMITIVTILMALNNLFVTVFADAAEPGDWDLQEPACSIQEGLMNLHDDVMFILFLAFGLVLTFLIVIILKFAYPELDKAKYKEIDITHHTLLEFIWTITPSFILVLLICPTFALLYSLDDAIENQLTIKVIGHQWYWSYEYGDLTEKFNQNFTTDNLSYTFDSYMLAEDDLQSGQLRLLEVDNRLILPIKVHIRLMITSTDVLHSWAVPSLGVKMDACPGRLNQVMLYIARQGIFYGQCSEICGIRHAFMPICIETV